MKNITAFLTAVIILTISTVSASAGTIYEQDGKYGYNGSYTTTEKKKLKTLFFNCLLVPDNFMTHPKFYKTKTVKYKIPAIYDKITDLNNNKILVEKDGKKGLIYNENTVIPVEYDNITSFCINNDCNYHKTEKNNKYGICCSSGNSACSPDVYDDFKIQDQWILTTNNSKFGACLTKNPKLCVPALYDDIEFRDDLIITTKDSKKGAYSVYYDRIVHSVYEDFDKILSLENNVITAEKNKKTGTYKANEENKILIPVKYDFVNSYGIIKENNLYGIYLKNIKINPIYDDIIRNHPDYIIKKDGKYGLILNSYISKYEIIEAEYDEIKPQDCDTYLLKKSDEYFILKYDRNNSEYKIIKK